MPPDRPDRLDHTQQKQKQQKQQHSLQPQRGARAKRARPFIVSVPAVVSAVLFDQDLDQKLTWAGLGWPVSSPGLAQQALGWALVKSWENWPTCHFFRQVASKRCIFDQF